MPDEQQGEITQLLNQISAGEEGAKDALIDLAYQELRALAAGLMRHERPNHTLDPTAVVHEASLRLLKGDVLSKLPNRATFFSAMSTAMRRALVDHARQRHASRRQGEAEQMPLDEVLDALQETHGFDLLALEEALEQMETFNKRQCAVVVQRFFGGYEMKEIAENLDVSISTVEQDWRIARAWLRRQLSEG